MAYVPVDNASIRTSTPIYEVQEVKTQDGRSIMLKPLAISTSLDKQLQSFVGMRVTDPLRAKEIYDLNEYILLLATQGSLRKLTATIEGVCDSSHILTYYIVKAFKAALLGGHLMIIDYLIDKGYPFHTAKVPHVLLEVLAMTIPAHPSASAATNTAASGSGSRISEESAYILVEFLINKNKIINSTCYIAAQTAAVVAAAAAAGGGSGGGDSGNGSDSTGFSIGTGGMGMSMPIITLTGAEECEIVNLAAKGNYLTPLHIAIRYGLFTIVTLLLQHGADVNAIGDGDVMPLSLAYMLRDSHQEGIFSTNKSVIQEKVSEVSYTVGWSTDEQGNAVASAVSNTSSSTSTTATASATGTDTSNEYISEAQKERHKRERETADLIDKLLRKLHGMGARTTWRRDISNPILHPSSSAPVSNGNEVKGKSIRISGGGERNVKISTATVFGASSYGTDANTSTGTGTGTGTGVGTGTGTGVGTGTDTGTGAGTGTGTSTSTNSVDSITEKQKDVTHISTNRPTSQSSNSKRYVGFSGTVSMMSKPTVQGTLKTAIQEMSIVKEAKAEGCGTGPLEHPLCSSANSTNQGTFRDNIDNKADDKSGIIGKNATATTATTATTTESDASYAATSVTASVYDAEDGAQIFSTGGY